MDAWNSFLVQFIDKEGYKTVLEGLGATVMIAVLGMLIGAVIGTILAITKVVPQYRLVTKIFSGITTAYVALFRGTPMVVQLLIAYYVLLPLMGISASGIVVGVVVFGLNSGAYISEIMRGGINSVDGGQMEAGRALGLGFGKTMTSVVIPQAIKNILPSLGNEFIVLIKETSVLSFIAVVDLTKAFRSIGDANYEYVVPYLMLGLAYILIVGIITLLIRVMEKGLRKSDRRS